MTRHVAPQDEPGEAAAHGETDQGVAELVHQGHRQPQHLPDRRHRDHEDRRQHGHRDGRCAHRHVTGGGDDPGAQLVPVHGGNLADAAGGVLSGPASVHQRPAQTRYASISRS